MIQLCKTERFRILHRPGSRENSFRFRPHPHAPSYSFSFPHPVGQTVPRSKKEVAKLARAITIANETLNSLAQAVVHKLQNPAREDAKLFSNNSNPVARHVIPPNCAVMRRPKAEPQKRKSPASVPRSVQQRGLP